MRLLLALVLVGCGDDRGGGGSDGGVRDTGTLIDTLGATDTFAGGGGDHVDGTVISVGGTPPAMGKTFVLWSADSGQSDYKYKYGEGTATMTTFTTNVASPVPNEASFGGVLGISYVGLFPSSATLADGAVPTNYVETMMLGYTGRYRIIFRPNANPFPQGAWANDFAVGLSCGRCVDSSQGNDRLTPVPCSEMVLQVGTFQQTQGCNLM
jgi:hypothetical protein